MIIVLLCHLLLTVTEVCQIVAMETGVFLTEHSGKAAGSAHQDLYILFT